MIGLGAAAISLALIAGAPPPSSDERPDPYELREPEQLRALPSNPRWAARYRRSSSRMFIASAVLFGLVSAGEKIAAGVAVSCTVGQPCAVSLTYVWGSPSAGTRYTLLTSGSASAYVFARTLAVPLVWVGEGLLLGSAHTRALADFGVGRPVPPDTRRVGWILLGSGLGLYLGSRLLRLSLALAGVGQTPALVYGFDQLSLGSSRALAFTGSALLLYRRTGENVRLGVAPTAGLGLGLGVQF